MRIIFVTGLAGSGKDTIGYFISKYYKGILTTRQEAFATGVKAVATILGWNGEKDEDGRRLLQEVGTTARNYDKNHWARDVVSRLCRSAVDVTYITDLRYDNEYGFIWERFPHSKMLVIKVDRKSIKQMSHESEQGVNPNIVDTIIRNDGTLLDLQTKVFEVLDNWEGE